MNEGALPAAVAYARRSVEDKTKRSLSMHTQLSTLREVAAHRGWQVIGEFGDDGISGVRWNRPGISEAIAAAPEGGHFLIFDLDRFSRENELLWNLVRQLRAKRVLLSSRTTDYPDTVEGDAMLAMGGLVASGEHRKITARITAWRRSYAEAGKHAGRPPYGYRGAGQGRLQIDPAEAPAVRLAYALADRGKGASHIAKRLNESGLRTRHATGFTTSTICGLLHHPVYAGYTFHRVAHDSVAHDSSRAVPWRARWHLFEGLHPALVDRARWEALQDRFDARPGRSPSEGAYPFLLAGLLRCASCGRRMLPSYQYRQDPYRRYPVYHCPTACDHRPCPRRQYCRAIRLEQRFIAALSGREPERSGALSEAEGAGVPPASAVAASPGAPAALLLEYRRPADETEALRAGFLREIEAVADRERHLVGAVERGYQIPPALYAERQAALESRRAEVLSHLRRLDTAEPVPDPTEAGELATALGEILRDETLPLHARRDALRRHLAAVVYRDGAFLLTARR